MTGDEAEEILARFKRGGLPYPHLHRYKYFTDTDGFLIGRGCSCGASAVFKPGVRADNWFVHHFTGATKEVRA